MCRTFSQHKVKETDAIKWQIKKANSKFFRKEQSELDLLIDHELDHKLFAYYTEHRIYLSRPVNAGH